MLVWVRVSKNGQSLGRRQIKCESRLRELDQLLRASDHPLEFMCQVQFYMLYSTSESGGILEFNEADIFNRFCDHFLDCFISVSKAILEME